MVHFMDESAKRLAQAIGARVKQERGSLGWTLDGLAEAAGISRRMVVNVEQGAVNPSVATLLSLSDALGVGLPALVEPPAEAGAKITRRGDAAVLWNGDLGGRGVLVAGTESPDVVELWDWTMEAGESHVSDPHSVGTMELLNVHSGALIVVIDEVEHHLGAGDAMTFRGDMPHSYLTEGETPTHFAMAIYEPGVGIDARPNKEGH
ncbi:XRE family transcriptional regulator [Brevibacterium sp. S22]|nr:XRE family transcriptional regulator [Brevibacterium sp. S22]